MVQPVGVRAGWGVGVEVSGVRQVVTSVACGQGRVSQGVVVGGGRQSGVQPVGVRAGWGVGVGVEVSGIRQVVTSVACG